MTSYCDAPAPDGDPCSRPCPDAHTVCGGCLTRLTTELAAVGLWEEELATTRYRQDTTRRQGPAVAGAGETGLPYNDRPTDAANEAATVMQQWTVVLLEADRADGLDLAGPEHVDGGPILAPYAEWLSKRADQLAGHPDGGMAVGDLRRTVGRLRASVDLHPDLLYAGPCDSCTEHLYAHPAAPVVTCRGSNGREGCGARYDLGQRRAWLVDQLRDQHATLTRIAGCMTRLYGETVTVERMLNWTRREQRNVPGSRLRPVGEDSSGRSLYRIGDVVDRLEASAAQQLAKRQARAS
ncbi:hypothetical protein [Actinomycetospora aeridis]|uniref:Helix-turn-helix DNA binding domain protein n=1 Tax=Actinomycetospora aeridis TaxID=3129231 RepID=A0ABU8N1A4_9PSEU